MKNIISVLKRKALISFISLMSIISCKKETHELSNNVAERTVFVYMAANNNLTAAAIQSLNQMEAGAKNANGNLIVLLQTNKYRSDLLRVKYDKHVAIASDTLITYGNENTSSPVFLKRVIADVKRLAPAKAFGMVLWSHGTSWYPRQINAIEKKTLGLNGVSLKAFGYDRGETMDIIDLKNALPDHMSFLLLDACSMGSIEVLYELRNKADYIISSPTEVLSYSFPYERITPLMFGRKEDFIEIAELYLDSYRKRQDDAQSASISVIDTGKLHEIASFTSALLTQNTFTLGRASEGVVRTDFDPNSLVPAYDFNDFLQKKFSLDTSKTAIKMFSELVLFNGNTQYFLGHKIEKLCGISTYIPQLNDKYSKYYSNLEWATASGYNRFFYGI